MSQFELRADFAAAKGWSIYKSMPTRGSGAQSDFRQRKPQQSLKIAYLETRITRYPGVRVRRSSLS